MATHSTNAGIDNLSSTYEDTLAGKTSSAAPAECESMATVNLYQEWSREPRDSTIEEVVDTTEHDLLRVRAHLVAGPAKRLSSKSYLATVRRRRSKRIADLVKGLAQYSGGQDFPVWTQQVLHELLSLIHELSEAEQFRDVQYEGNSCEILRQIRDTFLDAGWEHYRREEVRDCVATILSRMSEALEVMPDDADGAMDQLLDLGLNPAVGLQLSYEQEEQ